MQFDRCHSWDLSLAEARAWQDRLRPRLRTDRPLDFAKLRTVAGVDVAYEPRRGAVRRGHWPRFGTAAESTLATAPAGDAGDTEEPSARFVAAVVVMSFPDLEIIEQSTAEAATCFPYVPTFLTFREGPALELALAALRHAPEAIIFDGQGVAHPRGLGLAAHLGLFLGLPSVGCAKSRLYGVTSGDLGRRRGSRMPLQAPPMSPRLAARQAADPAAWQPGQRVGTVLRTRDGVQPVWVSCGHLIDLPGAEELVLRTARRWRLPEPIRAAHHLVNGLLRERLRRESAAAAESET